MGVNAKYVSFIGLDKSYNFIKCYKDSKCRKYKYAEEFEYIDNYVHVIFEDLLPPNFICLSDNMSCEYSCIGLSLCSSEYLDEIGHIILTPQSLQEKIDYVYNELNAIGIKCDKHEVKLHSFVHFS